MGQQSVLYFGTLITTIGALPTPVGPRSSSTAAVGPTLSGGSAPRSASRSSSVISASPPQTQQPPRLDGGYVVVFNASVVTCGAGGHDNVDSPARAFVGSDGLVRLTASCKTARFMQGTSLDTVQHRCNIVHNSTMNPNPQVFAQNEWIHAT